MENENNFISELFTGGFLGGGTGKTVFKWFVIILVVVLVLVLLFFIGKWIYDKWIKSDPSSDSSTSTFESKKKKTHMN